MYFLLDKKRVLQGVPKFTAHTLKKDMNLDIGLDSRFPESFVRFYKQVHSQHYSCIVTPDMKYQIPVLTICKAESSKEASSFTSARTSCSWEV